MCGACGQCISKLVSGPDMSKSALFFKHFTVHKKIICTPIVVKSACPFRIVCKAVICEKIKIVVLLVRQLQHGFTKIAKVSPNLIVAHLGRQIICCSEHVVAQNQHFTSL